MYSTERKRPTPHANPLACDYCGSWPCLCDALHTGKWLLRQQSKRLQRRVVSTATPVQETYAAGLRTGELVIADSPVRVIDVAGRSGRAKPAAPRSKNRKR